MALRFFALRPRFLLREVSRGDGLGALARVSILSVKTSQPGPTTGAFLQSVPHRHRDTNTGPGSVAPQLRLGITYARAYGRKDKYQNNGNSMMINNGNPNTPPRGPTLLSFCAGKRKRKNKSGEARQVPVVREDSSCLRSSSGLPLALHHGAMAGRPATTLQVGTTAWRLTAAAARRVAVRRRTSEARSEERRVGKECRSRWSPYH